MSGSSYWCQVVISRWAYPGGLGPDATGVPPTDVWSSFVDGRILELLALIPCAPHWCLVVICRWAYPGALGLDAVCPPLVSGRHL